MFLPTSGVNNRALSDGHDVVVLSSTDEDEANRDLTLEILQRARRRGEKRKITKKKRKITNKRKSKNKAEYDGVVVDLITTSSDECQVVKTSKKRRKKTNNLEKEENTLELVLLDDDADADAEGAVLHGLEEEDEPEVNEAQSPPPPNQVLRKLLRIPRYFDSEGCSLLFCYNCSKDGHIAANCRLERRKKPCFVCGMFGHDAKKCPQGHDCFICKRRGHLAKNCPDKGKNTLQNSKLCLRCGDLGHDMARCIDSYDLEDLKEIQCYVCKHFGHLCCIDATDTDGGSTVVACYNCGLTGHSGVGCANNKVHFPTSTTDSSPMSCYKCGEEGHSARGCSKNVKGSGDKVRSPTSIGDSRTMCFKCGVEGHFKRDCPMKDKSAMFSDGPKTPPTNPRVKRNGDGFETRSEPRNSRFNFGRESMTYHNNNGNHNGWWMSSDSHKSMQHVGYPIPPPLRRMPVYYGWNMRYLRDHGRNDWHYRPHHPAAGCSAAPRFNNNPANHHWK